MSVRINLEIGHEASIRTKRTPEGFTHDWEVFVRGCDGAEIHHYVEKVVFHLHETFPKPKRVVKEPPYTVKESGYAGFTLPIEIYLRNREEPKKIRFNYDLNLQNNGPPIVKVQKEKWIFNSPVEDFRYKLLNGGGTVVNTQDTSDSRSNINDDKTQMTSKPKLSGTDIIKKHKTKLDEPRITDSFHELFGTPITKTSKISPESKPKDSSKNVAKAEKGSEKEKSKSKHSPHKDKEKSKDRSESDRKNRDDKKKDKEKNKDKDRDKDKLKHEKSPAPRSSSPKRSPKRPSSPKRSASPFVKHKEDKKSDVPKDKDKSADDKIEKKQKKEKRDKEKDHKENKHKERELQKSLEQKEKKEAKMNKTIKEKELSASPKVERKEKTKDFIAKEPKEQTPVVEKSEKSRGDKSEEKPKHKHKKKDKDRKEKKSEKESSNKTDKKEKPNALKYNDVKETPKESEKSSLFDSPKSEPVIEEKSKDKKKNVNSIRPEFTHDSSNSPISSPAVSPKEPVSQKIEFKKELLPEPKETKPPPEKSKPKKEKSKKNKDKKSDKEEKKRKRKSEGVTEDEPPEKIIKEDSNSNVSDIEQNNTNVSVKKDIDKENQENPEDYMQILRDLQHKITTLQDNSELQKVVQLVAETGRFEVSARTFDFDLCLLERSTVRQLQEFFAGTT